jgi:hypothetical protein
MDLQVAPHMLKEINLELIHLAQDMGQCLAVNGNELLHSITCS